MAEHTIAINAQFRDKVLDGSKHSARRPGHRDFALGPATIRFIGQTAHSSTLHWTDDPPVDVMLTKVEHTLATGGYASFMMFLRDNGITGEDEGRLTVLEWELL